MTISRRGFLGGVIAAATSRLLPRAAIVPVRERVCEVLPVRMYENPALVLEFTDMKFVLNGLVQRNVV